ncbi:MAG: hypothetical protein KAR06_08185, partial [Deltaproteobacteria bacterium]|nr:hypothetical protein [Deltaproteobacteria bacterium]
PDKKHSKSLKHVRQKFFVARELQLTIALLVVIALLGGIFLQYISTALKSYYQFESHMLGVVMILGYLAIVFIISIVFSHRFVGPFRRLADEMIVINKGDLGYRLSVRTKDDVNVRNFVDQVNDLILTFEKKCVSQKVICGELSASILSIKDDITLKNVDMELISKELHELQKKVLALKD